MGSVRQIVYASKQNKYKLNQNDKLIIRNQTYQYGPFCDYTFSGMPKTVIESRQNYSSPDKTGTGGSGRSGSVENVFTFTEPGDYTMTVIHMSNIRQNILHKIEIIVVDPYETKSCSIL